MALEINYLGINSSQSYKVLLAISFYTLNKSAAVFFKKARILLTTGSRNDFTWGTRVN